MKKLFLLVLLAAKLTGRDQQPFTGKAFYCPSFKRKYVLQIKNDTLYTQNFRYDAYPPDPDMKQKINFLREQNGFTIYYIKDTEHKTSVLGSRTGDTYALVGCKLSPDGDKLSIAYETQSYTSLEECKKINFDPGARFTLTYFSKSYYDKFNKLKPVKDVDSLTANDIYSRLKQQAIANQERFKRFGVSMYGTAEIRELLNRVLIAMQINPVISEEDFNRYTEKYVVKNGVMH